MMRIQSIIYTISFVNSGSVETTLESQWWKMMARFSALSLPVCPSWIRLGSSSSGAHVFSEIKEEEIATNRNTVDSHSGGEKE